jgi:hypothetical protein
VTTTRDQSGRQTSTLRKCQTTTAQPLRAPVLRGPAHPGHTLIAQQRRAVQGPTGLPQTAPVPAAPSAVKAVSRVPSPPAAANPAQAEPGPAANPANRVQRARIVQHPREPSTAEPERPTGLPQARPSVPSAATQAKARLRPARPPVHAATVHALSAGTTTPAGNPRPATAAQANPRRVGTQSPADSPNPASKPSLPAPASRESLRVQAPNAAAIPAARSAASPEPLPVEENTEWFH